MCRRRAAQIARVPRVERWEHRTVLIRRTAGVWSIQFADGQSLEGIDVCVARNTAAEASVRAFLAKQ